MSEKKIKSKVEGKPYRNPDVMKRMIAAIVAMAAIIVVLLIFLAATIWSNNGGSSKGSESGKTTDSSKKKTETAKTASADVSGIIAPSDDNGNIGDHVRGNAESKVVLVEYADLQCPGCAGIMSVLGTIYDEYKDRVAFVYRHYPLSFHELAEPAAKAVEAASKQGYFWESLTYLFSVRASWVGEEDAKTISNLLTSYLTSKYDTFNVDNYYASLNDEAISKKIAFDYKIGKEKSYISATPSLFVNGKEISFTEAKGYSEIAAIIRSALDEALKN